MEKTLNQFQTPLTEELLNSLPEEVRDELLDVINNVEFIQNLISPNRERAKDRPRDERGRIIVDLCKPHILENMDYFREAAIHFEKHGCYTFLKPNGNPNSEYGKWIRQERDRCWDGMVRPEDGEWITGPMYFYLNYCPIILSDQRENTSIADRITAFPKVWEGIYWRFHYIEQARSGGIYNDWKGALNGAELASRGKAFAYSQEVETPTGRRVWKDIQIGDTLFAPDGSITKVIDIPFDEEHDVYKMTLQDGRSVYTTLEHLWKINKNGENWNKLYTTEEILKSKSPNRFAIEVSEGVEYRYKEIPIEPYLLGLMLGDGAFTISKGNQAQLSSRAEDVLVYQKILGRPFKRVGNTEMSWLIDYPKFGEKAKILGLHDKISDTKFIPDCYKYNSREVRLELLAGLLDTDGSVHDSGRPEFYTTSKQLALDVCWIARSLGYNATRWTRSPKYTYKGERKEGKLCYIVYIYTNDLLFKLPRKNSLCGKRGPKLDSRVNKTSVKSIEFSHRERCKCVTVDREDGLFLIGDFITTHNSKSYCMASMLAHNFVLGENRKAYKDTRSVVTAYQKEYLTRDGTLNKFEVMIDHCAQNTQFPARRLKSSVDKMNWIMGYVDLETGTKMGTKNEVLGVTSKDNIAKLRGKRSVFLGIEEFGSFPNLSDLYTVMRPSVRDGNLVFGLMYLQGCVCAGTKVWTADGRYVNIEELKQADGIVGFKNGQANKEPITWMQEPTEKECVKISFQDRELRCSTDHPILKRSKHSHRIENGGGKREFYYSYSFVPAGSLKQGDAICVAQKVGIFGNETLFDPYLVGLLIGDGSYGFNETPKFSNKDSELLNYVENNYETSLSASHVTKSKELYKDLRIKGITKQLALIGIQGQTKTNKRLPSNYMVLTEKDTAALIAGLYDTDGCVRDTGTLDIVLTQGTVELLEQVKVILKKFGVQSTIYTHKARIAKDRKDRRDCYNLVINQRKSLLNFAEHIPLKVQYKKDKLKNIVSKIKGIQRKRKYPEQLEGTFERVVQNIEFIGVHPIYNLTAGDSHTYLANDIITHNTAGDKDSDFAGAQEIMYNPTGYDMYALPNVYDKTSSGKPKFVFFFPGYVNREGSYNKDGVSDVTKSLIEILLDRYKIKYNSTDPNTIIKTIAEVPITPSEAILRTKKNIFPVTDLMERLGQLDSNPAEFNDVYVGEFTLKNGSVEFNPTVGDPIREFPHKDNKLDGAVEIFMMPQKVATDEGLKIPQGRYIASCDPVDDDSSETTSLQSAFVLDLWTDTIVAEYTGRPKFAEDYYEQLRRLCLFYNAKLNYENNKKGIFAYFSKMNSLSILTDTLEYLKDRDMIKGTPYGNKSKGVQATLPINNFARTLIRDWLLKPTVITTVVDGESAEVQVPNLFRLRQRALIKELIQWNSEGNFDRVSSLGMLMLLREDRMILYGGDEKRMQKVEKNPLSHDPFFEKNYKDHRRNTKVRWPDI